MTPDIFEEWKKHESAFTRKWRVSMLARKKHFILDLPYNDALRDEIKYITPNQKDCEAMLKDMCLIEAALATDQIVVSLDETARELFAIASNHAGEMRHIMWVNPDKSDEQPIIWLENGAQPEKNRQLAFRA